MVSQHVGNPAALHHISRALRRRVIPERCIEAHARSLCAGEILKCVRDGVSAHRQTIRATPHRSGPSKKVDPRSMPQSPRMMPMRRRGPEVRARYRDYVHRPDFFVVLLHCTDHDDQEIREASPARTAKIIKDMSERMKTIEDKFGHLMQVNRIIGRIRKGKGKPGEAIIKAANDEGACMIVCGTRGHGKIKRAFLGSVSDYVAHHSSVPVIICRRH